VNPEDALVYDIGAKNGGKPVQPNSRVEVKVPVSFSEDVQVYSIKNGAVTKLDSSVSGGKVVFRTNSLSTFVIGTKPTPQHSLSVNTESTRVSVDGGASVVSYSGSFAEGTKVVLVAQPDDGYTFTGYYIGGSLLSSEPRLEYSVTSDASIRAVSEPAKYQVRLSGDDCAIYVNGRNVGGSFDERLEIGTHVQANAVALEGYTVSGWSGTFQSKDSVCDFFVNGDVDVKAVTEAAVNGTVKVTVKLVLSGPAADDYGSIFVGSKEVGTTYIVTLETEGAPATVSVLIPSGYLFDGWMYEGMTYQSKSLAIKAGSDDMEVVGMVVSAPSHMMRVVAEGGTVYMDGEATDRMEVKEGVSVILSQVPEDGYRFVGWFVGDGCVSTSEHYNAIMGTSDVTYEARYSKTVYDVDLTAINATLVVDGVSCGGSYQGTVPEGGEMVFEAVPAEGFVFDSWILNGELYSKSKITVKGVSSDIVATAKAVPAPMCSIAVSINDGTIEYGGEDVGAHAVIEVREGQSVTLKAKPDYGYAFRYWVSGDRVLSSKAEYTFSAPGDMSVSAVVESTLRDVTVKAANGGLIINSVNVGSEYRTKLYLGEDLVVNAAPGPGYTFSRWDVNGKIYGAEYQSLRIVMGSSDILAVAEMAPMEDSTLQVVVLNGTVRVNGEDCGSSYSAVASAGEEYTLVAVPDNGYSFDHWIIDRDTSDYQQITVTMGTDHVNVSAVMKKNDVHRLTVSIQNGKLYLDEVDKGSKIDVYVEDKQIVKIKATPDAGYALAGWYEGSEAVYFGTEYELQIEGDVDLVVKTLPSP
ncbi:MAG: InlB B-repeat-containing protein, partial [Candidatus Methanomethylophilaceae archaeon]|nr:InlB B-repeat-containing protein [Candidatus Methanomethylophilaceae archaeon]